jgi:uncharacterized protein YjbI with pentapeptide repeats
LVNITLFIKRIKLKNLSKKLTLILFLFLIVSCQKKINNSARIKNNKQLLFDHDFSRLNAPNSEWIQAYLRRSSFFEANLDNANFASCFAFKTDFRKASLKNANFSGCDLRYADFRKADLRGASFSNALIYDARFEGAQINQNTQIEFTEGTKGALFSD